jgi:23S rRNA (adenine2503-C2)-methyltransferase
MSLALLADDVPDAATERVRSFYDFDRQSLEDLLEERGLPRYRAAQMFNWVYKKGVTSLDEMKNFGKEAREKLSGLFDFPSVTIKDRQISVDGTRKYLFGLADGRAVESVMIKQPNRMTLCVSSQVGCGMGCKFCRTATMGFVRNLTASEILQQVRGVIEDAKNFEDMFSNIVFMGMGEPLHNLKNITTAIKILTDEQGLEIAPRRVTVSTSGLVTAIKKFGAEHLNVCLAVSLNATTDEVRSQVMPINKAFPLSELLGALREFPLEGRKKITFEYVMLHGINDSEDDLKRLPKLLNGIQSKVNLIPYNENAGLGFKAPPRDWVYHWQDKLLRTGLDATVRWSKGADISAACGQLATEKGKQIMI